MSSGDIQDGTILFTLGNAVLPSTRITLVDPVAEQLLLGGAGGFLAPLAELTAEGPIQGSEVTEWANNAQDEFAQRFLDQQVALAGIPTPFTPELLDELRHLHESNGSTFGWGPESTTYVPMVVRETGPAPFTVAIEVEKFGPAPAVTGELRQFPYKLPEDMTAGEAGARLAVASVDASSLLNPFSDGEVLLPWPGTSAEGVRGMPWFGSLSVPGVGIAPAPEFEVLANEADGVEVGIPASGYVYPLFGNNFDPNSYISVEADGSKVGMESVFGEGVTARALMLDHGLSAVAVGGFELDGIADLQSELNHVPLGAYGAVGSTLIPGSSDAAVGAAELNPSVSGLGLVSPDTVAIAALSSARCWLSPSPEPRR